MKYITGRELKEMFEKGLPLTIEIAPERVLFQQDEWQENYLYYDTDFSPRMRADVVNVKSDHELLELVLDLSNWESYNNRFDLPNHTEGEHVDLKWCETKRYKKFYNGHTIIRTSIYAALGTIHEFTLVGNAAQELHQKFLESSHPNYVQWLESQIRVC
jgi:hypothetical protein